MVCPSKCCRPPMGGSSSWGCRRRPRTTAIAMPTSAPLVHGAVLAGAGPSLDPISDLQQLTSYPFMVHALLAGTIVAVMAGVVGWFMVLRRQTFAGHTMSVMAFPGA